jgi:hypothetical protein
MAITEATAAANEREVFLGAISTIEAPCKWFAESE